jgi:hypothetical protein
MLETLIPFGFEYVLILMTGLLTVLWELQLLML